MTPVEERIDHEAVREALRLSEAATPGPWELHGRLIQNVGESWAVGGSRCAKEVDAEFIAGARTLLPELARQLSAAQAALDQAEQDRDEGWRQFNRSEIARIDLEQREKNYRSFLDGLGKLKLFDSIKAESPPVEAEEKG